MRCPLSAAVFIAALGLKSVLGGLLATLMNAAVAGALWSFVH